MYVHICTHTHIHVYTYIHIYVYICVHIYTYIYMYLYIHIRVNIHPLISVFWQQFIPYGNFSLELILEIVTKCTLSNDVELTFENRCQKTVNPLLRKRAKTMTTTMVPQHSIPEFHERRDWYTKKCYQNSQQSALQTFIVVNIVVS